MKGVVLLCVIYALLPIAVVYLISLFYSGFPVVPVLIGLGLLLSHVLEK